MAGKPDPEYVKARRVLLDALVSLAPHADALVLVGAQAIYLHVGPGDLAVAPYTGVEMVVRATEGLEDPATIRGSCVVLASDLLEAIGGAS